ncbi:hypothetical protein Q7P37_000723 [Cladosporium fusiforme]
MTPSITSDFPANGSNTNSVRESQLKPGIYVPTVAFFSSGEQQTVDVETTTRHAQSLASSGVTGIVTHGSNGEAVHLSHDERMLVTRTTREALVNCGHADMALLVGCGAPSTQETIKLCKDAAKSGGDFALVLPPSYYGSLLTTTLILDFFRAVADASPIPLVIYNFPAVQGGLDLNSDQIIELAQHPNIVGVKLTCGNTGKLTRVAAATSSTGFATMGGSADFLLPTLIGGGQGVIAGLANLSPKTHVKAMQLYEQGRIQEAQKLAAVLARGDWVAIKGGFIAVKTGLRLFCDYGGMPRLPCVKPSDAAEADIKNGFAEMMESEACL